MAAKVGIFFGSSTGITEDCAYQIHEAWSETDVPIDEPIDIGKVKDLNELLKYDFMLIGIPTWNIGELQDDWYEVFDDLNELDFKGKLVAMFGEGDQLNYPDNYLDAMGILGRKLEERGAKLVVQWSTEGYDYYESLAVEDGKFIGLALDNTNQPDLTEERIQAWIPGVIKAFSLD